MKRVVTVLLVVMMILPYAGAVPILDASTRFLLEGKEYMETTQQLSLSLIALASSYPAVENLTMSDIDYFVDALLTRQNPDGGWGYYEGSVSNVVDTSYAVIALKKTLAVYEGNKRSLILNAIERGVDFLVDSYNGKGWGYVPNTLTEFYPTLMAVWALGEMGYSKEHPYIKSAIEYLEKTESYGIRRGEAVALKLLAYHSVGYVSPGLREEAWKLVDSPEITVKERAFLTYALLVYDGLTFETAKLLTTLEDLKEKNESFVYWANKPGQLIQREVFVTSALATWSFAKVSGELAAEQETPFGASCSELEKVQNKDGGWPYIIGFSSTDRATYYALKALKKCYFMDESIEKGIEWVKGRIDKNMEISSKSGEIYPPYIYNLLTLLEFNLVNESEKAKHIAFIKGLKKEDGKWGDFLGLQPYDTALAIKALLALGVSPQDEDIAKAKEWLLSFPTKGWGTVITTKYYTGFFSSEVSTTIEVLEALQPLVTKEDVEKHLNWLLNQRTEDGGWPNVKESYIVGVLMYQGQPSVELTIRATEVLYAFGIDYRQETLQWLLPKKRNNLWGASIIDSALATLYFSTFEELPKPVNLYEVIRALPDGNFKILYTFGRDKVALSVKESLDMIFGTNMTAEEFKEIGDGNYIVLADLTEFDLSKYNPYVELKVDGESLYLNGKGYKRDGTMVIVPGKTSKGYILFVLYPRSLEGAVKVFLASNIVKYLNGVACVVTYEDKNKNGIVELEELKAEFVR
ncbi:prenyltransferase/squalene oxidase repeat-containing protein [Thermococcus sp. 2319x1]|uniref:prenyltransferase/squalene oxidase repeat-containing protein n=1 Tax=Thermococcus sp. 2319x1 TaxID=1674923 RepID=UPI0015842F0E|nr:prenyltransferase/squalene oxidase repeat-containing protein [Thermococcus sp. 2319x1]